MSNNPSQKHPVGLDAHVELYVTQALESITTCVTHVGLAPTINAYGIVPVAHSDNGEHAIWEVRSDPLVAGSQKLPPLRAPGLSISQVHAVIEANRNRAENDWHQLLRDLVTANATSGGEPVEELELPGPSRASDDGEHELSPTRRHLNRLKEELEQEARARTIAQRALDTARRLTARIEKRLAEATRRLELIREQIVQTEQALEAEERARQVPEVSRGRKPLFSPKQEAPKSKGDEPDFDF